MKSGSSWTHAWTDAGGAKSVPDEQRRRDLHKGGVHRKPQSVGRLTASRDDFSFVRFAFDATSALPWTQSSATPSGASRTVLLRALSEGIRVGDVDFRNELRRLWDGVVLVGKRRQEWLDLSDDLLWLCEVGSLEEEGHTRRASRRLMHEVDCLLAQGDFETVGRVVTWVIRRGFVEMGMSLAVITLPAKHLTPGRETLIGWLAEELKARGEDPAIELSGLE